MIGTVALWPVVRRTFRMLYHLARRDITALIILLVLQGVTPAAIILLTKATVDGITRLVGGEAVNLVLLAVMWLGTLLADQILAVLVQQVQGNVSERLTTGTTRLLIQRVATLPGLDVVEDPRYHNDLEVLQRGAQFRPLNITLTVASLLREGVTGISVSLALISVAWWAPLVLIVLGIPYARQQLRMRERMWRLQINRTPEARELAYDGTVAMSTEFAKDVRLHNLTSWLLERYSTRATRLQQESRAVRGQENWRVLPSLLLSVTGAGSVFVYAVASAQRGLLTLGDVIVAVQALSRLQSAVTEFVAYLGLLTEHLAYFKQLLSFLDATPGVHEPTRPSPLPEELGVTFEGVTFQYADGRTALRDLSIHIPERQIVALVGENGAGKSTFVKLLLRYYDPSTGRILVGGTDLRTLSINEWRRQFAAVFQDFGRFQYTVAENVTLGLARDEQRLDEAIKRSNFMPVVLSLPQQADTRLGKAFGGTELSGGQWQKLALSRALYRDARILVLDEPTSALDPRSEAEVYEHFSQLARGRTALLVTHRLSSVRMADRILVLKDGCLVEDGTHQELLERNGEYAELWRLQSKHYAELDALTLTA